MYTTLSEFYSSGVWKDTRLKIIYDRTDTEGFIRCEECGKIFKAGYEIIAHHIKPLTLQNVNDYSISLNPNNIKLVCGTCHNEIHKRFGYCTQRKVYIVCGSPCAGKNYYVNNNKGNSDIIVDMDLIWQCITGGEKYTKPNALKTNAFTVRDCLLDMIRTRAGKWERAWIITTLPRKGERENMVKLYGAELIHIDTDKTTCLNRLGADPERKHVMHEWEKYINDYFDNFQE